MHYFDNFLLLKQCYFDEKYSEFIRFVTFPDLPWKRLTLLGG